MKLNATGEEQDWEFELANPKKIPLMLEHLNENDDLDLDGKAALALLTIASLEEKESSSSITDGELNSLSDFFAKNNAVKERMFFYWITLSKTNSDILKKYFYKISDTNSK